MHYIMIMFLLHCSWILNTGLYFIKNTKDFSGLHDKIYLPPSCRKVAKNISGDITRSVCLTPLYFFKHRNRSVIFSVNISVSICIDWLIGWCLTSTLAVFQLYRGVPLYVHIWIMYIWQWCSMPNTVVFSWLDIMIFITVSVLVQEGFISWILNCNLPTDQFDLGIQTAAWGFF